MASKTNNIFNINCNYSHVESPRKQNITIIKSGDYPSRGAPYRGTSRPAGLYGTPLIGVTPRPAGTYEAGSPQIGDDSPSRGLPSTSLTPPFSSVVIPPSLALVLPGPLRLSPTSRCQTHTDVGDNRLLCNTLLLLYNIGNKGHI